MPATLIDAWINRPPILDPSTLPSFVGELDELGDSHGRRGDLGADDDDDGYWDNYSVWRPGRLLTTQRDDLISEAAAEAAAEEKAHWARVDAAREEEAERER